jgi:DNA mismatch repair protein PMS2
MLAQPQSVCAELCRVAVCGASEGGSVLEIRFKDFGLKQIEVIDNGSGISPNDYSTIGRRH